MHFLGDRHGHKQGNKIPSLMSKEPNNSEFEEFAVPSVDGTLQWEPLSREILYKKSWDHPLLDAQMIPDSLRGSCHPFRLLDRLTVKSTLIV